MKRICVLSYDGMNLCLKETKGLAMNLSHGDIYPHKQEPEPRFFHWHTALLNMSPQRRV